MRNVDAPMAGATVARDVERILELSTDEVCVGQRMQVRVLPR